MTQSANAPALAREAEVRLMPNPNLAWREIDGEIIIISPADSFAHELNVTAGFIWHLLDGRLDAEAIASRVASEFMVPPEQALADTRELLASLSKKNLLVPAAREAK